MTIRFDTLRERWQADPAYRDACAEIAPEMDFAFAMAEARHSSALSQAEVSEGRHCERSEAIQGQWAET